MVNVLALLFLVAGMLYLEDYRRGLIESDVLTLRGQANIFAAAVVQGAGSDDAFDPHGLNPALAQRMVRSLVEASGTRARLFNADGKLVADSLRFKGPAGLVEAQQLPPPPVAADRMKELFAAYDRFVQGLLDRTPLPLYVDDPQPSAKTYAEVATALGGKADSAIRALPDGGLVLSVAVPMVRYDTVIGALMLTRSSTPIDDAMAEVRMAILTWFGIALGLTVLLSLYLARTIAYPIRKLAIAAETVRHDRQGRHPIPDFGRRNDEIGHLAMSLKEMTEALWQRIDAIEQFAADVSHELKNPLSSLRSAVETAARVSDPERRQKLMNIIQDDVGRLDRLITDISDASRLDAELSRAKSERVDICQMLATLVDVTETTAAERQTQLKLEARGPLIVNGIEGRLVQVFRNLIANALSFSPRGGTILLRAYRRSGFAVAEVLDDGPGIADGREKEIFQRFYSLRPRGEKFGVHSGLGLSISKQIVEIHGGTIAASNRLAPDKSVIGACFTVQLPLA